MIIKKILTSIFLFCVFTTSSLANKVIDINILGNERISKNTIKLFSNVNINDEIDDAKLNEILKIFMIQIFSMMFLLKLKIMFF